MLDHNWNNVRMILIALGVALIAITLLLIFRKVTFHFLTKWSSQQKPFGRLTYQMFRLPSIFWSIALGLMLGLEVSPVPEKYTKILSSLIQLALIFSFVVALANLLEGLLRHWLSRTNSAMANNGLIKTIVRGTIYCFGLLMALSQMGVQIGPLLTALGVGGLAVALAFKDTFENLFSGINLLIDRSLEVGDFLKLESGQEGQLIDVGWRTSKIRLENRDIVILPNTKLAQSITIKRTKTPV